MSRPSIWIGCLTLLASLAGCINTNSSPIGGKVDSESHWLEACTESSDCGALDCVCGVCTSICDGARDCGGEALCADLDGPRCDAPPLCTAACADRFDCPGAMRCVEGACVPLAEPAPGCLVDVDCADGEVCRDGACVAPEVCDAPDDADGDGFAGCADSDCLTDAMCPADPLIALSDPGPEVEACGTDPMLPDGSSLAETVALDQAMVARLGDLRASLSQARAGLAGSPGYLEPLDAAIAALASIEPRLAANRVEDCAAPACDAAELLTAELALLGEVMHALDRLDPGNATVLPFIDCAMAVARVRLGRRAQHYEGLCPAAFTDRDHGQWFDAIGWIQWAHDRALRAEVDCDVRRAYNECLPAELGAAPIDRTLLCDPV